MIGRLPPGHYQLTVQPLLFELYNSMSERIYRLLKRDLLNTPAFFAHQLQQAGQHFGTQARRIVGEVDQVTLAGFEDLEAESVPAME